MIISIHPQHPTPAGAHSLPQGGGLRLVAVPHPPQIRQREEGLHVSGTKEAQHHSVPTLLYLKQRQIPSGQLSCEGFPQLIPWEWQGASRAAHRRQPAPCSPRWLLLQPRGFSTFQACWKTSPDIQGVGKGVVSVVTLHWEGAGRDEMICPRSVCTLPWGAAPCAIISIPKAITPPQHSPRFKAERQHRGTRNLPCPNWPSI